MTPRSDILLWTFALFIAALYIRSISDWEVDKIFCLPFLRRGAILCLRFFTTLDNLIERIPSQWPRP